MTFNCIARIFSRIFIFSKKFSLSYESGVFSSLPTRFYFAFREVLFFLVFFLFINFTKWLSPVQRGSSGGWTVQRGSSGGSCKEDQLYMERILIFSIFSLIIVLEYFHFFQQAFTSPVEKDSPSLIFFWILQNDSTVQRGSSGASYKEDQLYSEDPLFLLAKTLTFFSQPLICILLYYARVSSLTHFFFTSFTRKFSECNSRILARIFASFNEILLCHILQKGKPFSLHHAKPLDTFNRISIVCKCIMGKILPSIFLTKQTLARESTDDEDPREDPYEDPPTRLCCVLRYKWQNHGILFLQNHFWRRYIL
jgi:hypothetical protein